MANLTLAQIEDAVLATIGGAGSPLRLAPGGYSRTLDSYGGQFEVENVQDILVLFPCLFVVMTEENDTELANKQATAGVLFSILVGDQNLRGNKAARKGVAGSIGAYKMMDDLRDLLHGSRAGLTEGSVQPLQLRRRVAVVNTPLLAIYACEFWMGFDFEDLN